MIGIYYICTGTYKVYFNDFMKSLSKFAPNKNKKVILLTDSDENLLCEIDDDKIEIEQHHIIDMPWPLVTLLKLTLILKYKDDDFSHIFYFNANCEIINDFDFEEYDAIFTLPPNWRDSSSNFQYLQLKDDNKFSKSYIGNNSYNYVQGGLFGGKSEIIYKMCEDIDSWVTYDLKMNIIPRWHDETYINKWVYLNKDNINIYYSNNFKYSNPNVKLTKNKKFKPKKDNSVPWEFKYSEIYNTKEEG